MSKAHRVLAGLATLTLTASFAACSGGGGGSVVTVNGTPITTAAFDQKLEGSPTARGVLQQMVQAQLIDQYAKDNNITVTDAEVQKKEDDLKARGLTEDDVHNALREQIIIDKALGKDIKVSPAQIKQYFDKNHAAFDKPEQVRARHILVADLKTANKVEADLKSGKNFADEAKQYSMDPGTKDKGGELGLFRRGQMVPAFDKAAFSLPIGQISQPVKSPFGYHIIQVEERQPGQKATLANTQDKIAETLRQQQEAPLMQPFLSGLMQKANIQVNDPRFAGIFPSPLPQESPASATTAAPAASNGTKP